MNTRQETKLQKIPPPLFRLIVVWFACPLRMVSSSVRSRQRTKLAAVDCCALGQDRPWFASSMPPNFRTILLCLSPLPPPNSWLLHPPVDPRPLDYLLNRFERVWGQLFYWSPLPSTSCAEEQLEPAIAPSSCCRGGCFISPTAKSMASMASEARGGISDGVGWLSPDDSEDIGHGFGLVDRWLMGVFVVLCAKKYGTWYVLSQKNDGPRSSLFLTAH